MLRTALYGWAFNPGRAGSQPPAQIEQALAWAQRRSLPLASLADPAVIRGALDGLTCRLDGSQAAAATITRKRAVFHNALGCAAELGLLPANPLSQVAWRPPHTCAAVDPRVVASPAQAEAILEEVTSTRTELTAFFGCLYYAALRPEEAVALTARCCDLPPQGWGKLTLSAAAPRSGCEITALGAAQMGVFGAVRGVEMALCPTAPSAGSHLQRWLRRRCVSASSSQDCAEGAGSQVTAISCAPASE